MSLFNSSRHGLLGLTLAFSAILTISGCQFQPLYGERGALSATGMGGQLPQVEVSQVSSRVGQQVRNHLVFLLGSDKTVEKTLRTDLDIRFSNRQLAAVEDAEDSTAGTVTVTVRYRVVNKTDQELIAEGQRVAEASYDRTGQVFANERAVRDAENRAAREAAEAVRLAIAADLSRSS